MIEIKLYFDLMESIFLDAYIKANLHLYVIDVRFSHRPMEDIHFLI